MTATWRDGHIVMQARALHHDRDSWLFYAHLRVDGAHVPLHGESPPTALAVTGQSGSKTRQVQDTGETSAGACAKQVAKTEAQPASQSAAPGAA